MLELVLLDVEIQLVRDVLPAEELELRRAVVLESVDWIVRGRPAGLPVLNDEEPVREVAARTHVHNVVTIGLRSARRGVSLAS